MDYDSTKQYPIVICLHHGGTHGNDNIRQVDGSPAAQELSTEANKKKYPAFLFVPQCPEGIGFGGIATLPAIDSLVFEALDAFEAEFSIDEKRRCVLNFTFNIPHACNSLQSRKMVLENCEKRSLYR